MNPSRGQRSRTAGARQIALAALVALSALGCATPSSPPCKIGTAATTETLYFGTDSPAGPVSEAQWRQFLAESVTPRFPKGFSTWEADGQWRGAGGTIVHERSHVLQVARFEPADSAAIAALAEEYKTRFQQEAVLRMQSAACVSF